MTSYENNLNRDSISNDVIQFNINDQLFLETLLNLIRGSALQSSSEKKRDILKE